MLTAMTNTNPVHTKEGHLNARERAIFRYIWKLHPDEIWRLTRHFMAVDSFTNFRDDCIERDGRIYLVEDKIEYEVILADAPTHIERSPEVGMSFRFQSRSNFAVVIVKCWNVEDTHQVITSRRKSHGTN